MHDCANPPNWKVVGTKADGTTCIVEEGFRSEAEAQDYRAAWTPIFDPMSVTLSIVETNIPL